MANRNVQPRGPWEESELRLDNGHVELVILPERGGKIASLRLLEIDRELLYQPDVRPEPVRYGARFDQNHSWGFDEMFPAIAREPYGAAPWSGREVPDHGELWSQPWKVESSNRREATLSVEGIAFPYRLRRRALLDQRTLRLEYTLENLSSHALEGIWAAHPLFSAPWGAELKPPEGFATIENGYPGERLPELHKRYAFEPSLASLPPQEESNSGPGALKYYFCETFTEKRSQFCLKLFGRPSVNVKFRVDHTAVPYLGVWINPGSVMGQHNIAPEPASGTMDALSVARARESVTPLAPGEIRRWWIELEADAAA